MTRRNKHCNNDEDEATLKLSVNVTPSDTLDLPFTTSELYIGDIGDVTVVNSNGDLVKYTEVRPGTTINVNTVRVMQTGTNVSNIVAREL